MNEKDILNWLQNTRKIHGIVSRNAGHVGGSTYEAGYAHGHIDALDKLIEELESDEWYETSKLDIVG